MTDSDTITQNEQPAQTEQPVAPPQTPAPISHPGAPAEHAPSHPGSHGSDSSHNERRHEGAHREGGRRDGGRRDSAPREGSQGASREPREPRAPRQLREENTIFIGRKATMGYVLAVVTQFQNGAPEVKIKARGKIISMAVDVAEIVRHRFLPDLKVGPITIQTEDVENEDHTRSKVSSIQIVLLK